jgi:hypothetical protein
MAFEKQGIKPGREGNQPTVNRSTSVFENEKKFREGKKFEPKETKGEKIRKILNQGKKENPKPRKEPPIKKERPRRVPGKKEDMIPLRSEGMYKPMAKGGRAMYKSGSKGCKLAMKGKGRAYGKNS